MRYIHMVRVMFSVLLCLSGAISAPAQIAAYQVSLIDSTQNILYVGFPNKVVMANLPAGAQVKFGGKYIKPSGNFYILSMKDTGRCKLSVCDAHNKVIFSKEYVASKVNGPILQLGDVKYRITSVPEVLAHPAVVFYSPGCQLKYSFRVVSYDLALVINEIGESKTVAAQNLSDVPFDKDIQDKIARMNNGDRIFIENIKAYGPDNTMRHLESINLQIALNENNLSGDSKLREKVRVIVDGIAADNTVRGKGYGWLEKLEEVATDSELVRLTDHENTAVRTYAFNALASRGGADIFPILLKHLNDTADVTVGSADVIISWKTNDYLALMLLPPHPRAGQNKLTRSQEATIDSFLLFDSSFTFPMRDLFLRFMKPDPKYYDRIRKIAISGKRPIAGFLLAKFKNEEDTSTIKKLFEKQDTEWDGIRSAREFPAPSFYPLLIRMFERSWKKLGSWGDFSDQGVLLQALAKYPTKETYRLFSRVALLNDKNYVMLKEQLLVAITKYSDPLFEPLKKKIKLDEYYQSQLKQDIETETW